MSSVAGEASYRRPPIQPSSCQSRDPATLPLRDSRDLRSPRLGHRINDGPRAGGDRFPVFRRDGAGVNEIAAERDRYGPSADELSGIVDVDATGRDQLQLRQGAQYITQ